jgi:LPS O-antigen subunit length determinant protein (WzzB/FepE family)
METNSSINLPDLFNSAWQWRKQIIAFTLIGTIVGTGIAFILPRYFQSTATVLATNPVLSDKQRIFSKNIQGLYSTYGGGDDAERLRGIAELDTCYKFLIDKYDLTTYYEYKEKSPLAMRNSIKALREDLVVERNDKDQLRIHCFHKNAETAANICNSTIEFMQAKAMEISQQSNSSLLMQLDSAFQKNQQEYVALSDSLNKTSSPALKQLLSTESTALLNQIAQDKQLINEIKITVNNNPNALVVLEKATASAKTEKPKRIVLILASLIGSLFFAILAALVFNRTKDA